MESEPLSMLSPVQQGGVERIGRIERVEIDNEAGRQSNDSYPIVHTTGVRNYYGSVAGGNARQHNGDVYVYGNYYADITDCEASNSVVDAISQNTALLKQLLEDPGLLERPKQRYQAPTTAQIPSSFHEEHDTLVVRPQQRRRKHKKHQKPTPFVLKLRPWFLSKLWHVSMTRSQNGWQANLQVWNVVPRDSLILQYAARGNMKGILDLIDDGLASPFDLDEYGRSIAQHCLSLFGFGNSQEVLRYYMDTTQADAGDTLFRFFNTSSQLPKLSFLEVLVDEYDLTLESCNDLVGRDGYPVSIASGQPEDAIETIQRSLSWRGADLPLQDRIRIAFMLTFPDAETFIRTTGLADNLGELANVADPRGRTAMHVVAEGFRKNQNVDEWEDLVRALHDHGSNLHGLGQFQNYSPLMTALWERGKSIQDWAQLLFNSGVDLVSYGKEEQALWSSFRGGLKINPFDIDKDFFIVDFIFGPMPHDWQVVVERFVHLPLFRTVRPPGSWSENGMAKYQVDRICWKPDEHETEETIWSEEEETRVFFEPRTWQQEQPPPKTVSRHGLHFKGLDFRGSRIMPPVEAMGYDDSAPLVLMLQRPPFESGRRRRSSSQPRMNQMARHESLHGYDKFHICFLSCPPKIHYHYDTDTVKARDCIRVYHNDHDEYWLEARENLERKTYWSDFENSRGPWDGYDESRYYEFVNDYMPKRRAEARARKKAEAKETLQP